MCLQVFCLTQNFVIAFGFFPDETWLWENLKRQKICLLMKAYKIDWHKEQNDLKFEIILSLVQ